MSAFKLEAFVAELLQILGGNVPPDKLVETLQKSIDDNATKKDCCGSQIILQKYIKHIVKHLENPEPFLSKLEDLKQKNVDSLESFIQLLDQISRHSGVKSLFNKSSNHELSKDDLVQVRNRLKKATSTSPPSTIQLNQQQQNLNQSLSTIPLASTPTMSSWVQRRPIMSWDFSSINLNNSWPIIPTVSQENAIIDDLLNILIGLPGCYIEAEELKDCYGPRTFKINDNLAIPLKELIKQILPIANYYSIIQRFAEEKVRFEFGQVNNALAEAMRTILKEHMVYVTQLEDEHHGGNLTLQKLWFDMQKRISALSVTATIATTISKSNAKGGKVLTLLHEYVIGSIGEEKAQQHCLKLMEAACVPYMKMLGMWIFRGIISDPISEFLVEDNEVIQKEDLPLDYSAEYWVKKYCIRRERVPKFLENVSDIILKTGKYLNVIRQCGCSIIKKDNNNKIDSIIYKINEKHYIQTIENAYKFASQTLLNLIINENDLIGRLRSVKHYFLLDQGDFIVTFMSLCEKELCKNINDIIHQRIETIMDLALRLSSAINDPYKDDLRTELLPYNLQFQMFRILTIQTHSEQDYQTTFIDYKNLLVIDSFAFSYDIHWPLSLILNRKSLACYQMIFRHLFYNKYVERMICHVWRSNKVAKKFHFNDAQHYRTAFALRQRMLHCVQNLEYHMMVEVIEPHWCSLIQKIHKANNIDEILLCHNDFLDCCLKDCMLTIPTILSTIMKLLTICMDFCKFMQNEKAFQEVNLQNSVETVPSFKEQIALFDVQFTASLKCLLDQINNLNRDSSEHDRLFNLLYRLDFNSFYTSQFEEMGFTRLKNDSSG